MLDSHLVMNALNLMAARDFRERGEENALLFALSDYLQEALQHPMSSALTLGQECKLARTQLTLLAELCERTATFEVSAPPQVLSTLLPAGSVARVVAALFSSASPRQMASLQITADFAQTAPDGPLSVTLDLLKSPSDQTIDMAVCRQRTEALWTVGDCPVALEGEAGWQQRRPDHLQLTYRLAPLPGMT